MSRLSTARYGRHLTVIVRSESWNYTACPGCPRIFIGGTDESQFARWETHAESGQCPGVSVLPCL
jgi:4-hydroxy-3-methylbut-2-en-1-yl diphosphate synthase IspG/GcpE